MKRGKRNSLLFKDISKRPIRIRLVHISQPGELLRNIRGILIGIMERTVRNIRSVEFRYVYLHPSVFIKTVYDVSGCLKVGESLFRIGKFRISIVPDMLRKLRSVVMSGYEIRPRYPPVCRNSGIP